MQVQKIFTTEVWKQQGNDEEQRATCLGMTLSIVILSYRLQSYLMESPRMKQYELVEKKTKPQYIKRELSPEEIVELDADEKRDRRTLKNYKRAKFALSKKVTNIKAKQALKPLDQVTPVSLFPTQINQVQEFFRFLSKFHYNLLSKKTVNEIMAEQPTLDQIRLRIAMTEEALLGSISYMSEKLNDVVKQQKLLEAWKLVEENHFSRYLNPEDAGPYSANDLVFYEWSEGEDDLFVKPKKRMRDEAKRSDEPSSSSWEFQYDSDDEKPLKKRARK